MSGQEIFMWGTLFGIALCFIALLLIAMGINIGKESKK